MAVKGSGNQRTPGEQATKSTTQAVTLRLPVEVYEAMRTYSFATQSSLNEVALRAIRDFLSHKGRDEQVDALLEKAQEQYRIALDKLADS